MSSLPVDLLWAIFREALSSKQDVWTSCLIERCIHNANGLPLAFELSLSEQYIDTPHKTRKHMRKTLRRGCYCPQRFLQQLRVVCKQWKKTIDRYTIRQENGKSAFRLVLKQDLVKQTIQFGAGTTYEFKPRQWAYNHPLEVIHHNGVFRLAPAGISRSQARAYLDARDLDHFE